MRSYTPLWDATTVAPFGGRYRLMHEAPLVFDCALSRRRGI